MEKSFYRVSEISQVLGICKSLAYELIATGEIPSVRIAGRKAIRVPATELEKWIVKETQKAQGGRNA
jgi:excisionase family DNA binding protein